MKQVREYKVKFEQIGSINFSYREQVKQSLLSLGVEHVAISVVMKSKSPYYIEISELRDKVKFSSRSRAIAVLDKYYSKLSEGRGERFVEVVNENMEVNYFCNEDLIIKKINPYLYMSKIELNCGSQVVLYFHSLEQLCNACLYSLKRFSDVIESWAISWLTHQRFLFSLASFKKPKPDACQVSLTSAEQDVLRLMLSGFTSNEIAVYRQVSKDTVRCQVKSLLSKTGCHGQNELIAANGYFNHLCYSLFD